MVFRALFAIFLLACNFHFLMVLAEKRLVETYMKRRSSLEKEIEHDRQRQDKILQIHFSLFFSEF